MEIRTVPPPKAGAASTRCDRFSATEISCQYTTCSSPSATYKLIHHRLYHPYRGICRTHGSTFVSRFTELLRVLQSRFVKMTYCYAIRFFLPTGATRCLGFTWFQYQMGWAKNLRCRCVDLHKKQINTNNRPQPSRGFKCVM